MEYKNQRVFAYFAFPQGDIIELVFYLCSESIRDIVSKVSFQECADHVSGVYGWHERPSIFFDIASVDDGFDD